MPVLSGDYLGAVSDRLDLDSRCEGLVHKRFLDASCAVIVASIWTTLLWYMFDGVTLIAHFTGIHHAIAAKCLATVCATCILVLIIVVGSIVAFFSGSVSSPGKYWRRSEFGIFIAISTCGVHAVAETRGVVVPVAM